jgi:xylulokinase
VEADAVDALVGVGVEPGRILLVGGAAANAAVAAVAATVFPAPIVVPPPGEYVADGAARQAAWILSGDDEAPAWSASREGTSLTVEPSPVPEVREAYRDARIALHGA